MYSGSDENIITERKPMSEISLHEIALSMMASYQQSYNYKTLMLQNLSFRGQNLSSIIIITRKKELADLLC